MPKPFICKNCGFDLELSPKHACTPASEISELDALKAQVERLRIALASTRQPHMDYIPMLDKTAQQVLDETPAQCLAEIKAQAYKQGLENCIDAAIDLEYLENDSYQCNQVRKAAAPKGGD